MRIGVLAALAVGVALPARAAEPCQMQQLAELPVTMHGLQPIVPIRVNGKELRFLADSGAFYSLIAPASARALGLRQTSLGDDARISGVGGDAVVTRTTVRALGFGKLDLHDIYFLVGGSEIGSGAVGLIGQNVLDVADAEYDLAGGAIRLLRSVGCGKQPLAYWAKGMPYEEVALERTDGVNRHAVGTVFVNGVKMRAMFDTGASTSVLTRAAAARAGVKPGDPGVVDDGYDSGLGRGMVRSWIAPFASFKIGDEEVRKTRLRFSEMAGLDYDMLVGADFFLAHRVYVANSQHRLYLTYNGGPVFKLDKPSATPGKAAAVAPAPAAGTAGSAADASELARRGAARVSRRDYAGALADLDRAVAAAPAEPRYLVQRAAVHRALDDDARARADLDAALKLRPDEFDALVARAGLALKAEDYAAARADALAAAAAASHEADARLDVGHLLTAVRAPGEAIGQYGAWLAVHRVDSRRAEALNGRCWARALAGRELREAVADCDAALREHSGDADVRDSRGMARLRLGDFARAIADYDAVLATAPKSAWSLYGRGLAKLRSGDAAGGRTDIAAALAIRPKLTADARAYGIVPAEGDPR